MLGTTTDSPYHSKVQVPQPFLRQAERGAGWIESAKSETDVHSSKLNLFLRFDKMRAHRVCLWPFPVQVPPLLLDLTDDVCQFVCMDTASLRLNLSQLSPSSVYLIFKAEHLLTMALPWLYPLAKGVFP